MRLNSLLDSTNFVRVWIRLFSLRNVKEANEEFKEKNQKNIELIELGVIRHYTHKSYNIFKNEIK